MKSDLMGKFKQVMYAMSEDDYEEKFELLTVEKSTT